MNQVFSLLLEAFKEQPIFFVSIVILFIVIVVIVGGGMYRVLLQPKLKRQQESNDEIKVIAENNTKYIREIKDDLNVKHYELKSDMKEFFHSINAQTKELIQVLVGGVTDQIKSMNNNNEKGHAELFAKVDELSTGYHQNEKRIMILEQK